MQDRVSPIVPIVTDFTMSRLRNVPRSAWLGHGPFALWLVEAMRPNRIVELGTHTGFSFFCFCQAMHDLGLAGTVHAIDTWEGDKHAGFYDTEIFASVEAVVQEQFDGVGHLHRTTFDAARDAFPDGSVDILHIDGLHTFDAVKHDFDKWRSSLTNPGVVLFHDTQVRRDDFGVHRLWDQLTTSHPSFEFLHSNGLGVLGIGDGFPEALQQLFDLGAQPDRAASVRRQFELMGREAEFTIEAEIAKSLTGRVGHIEAALEGMQLSRSWKVTAPLRKCDMLWRRVSGRS